MCTTTYSATGGPLSPDSGDAGHSFAWVVYRSGDSVHCPGQRTDRRTQPMRAATGDRRAEVRGTPCPQSWGRAGERTEVHIRVKPLHCGVEGPVGQLTTCPTCHLSIQIKHVAAARAA